MSLEPPEVSGSLMGLWMVVALLEAAMFAPLFRQGTVYLLDTPSYLLGPHPHPPGMAWGLPLSGRLPIEGALAWLYRTLPWGQVRLLPFLAIPPLAALGFARLLRRDALAASAATVMYVVNPFVYERMVAGQVYLLVGFALLPALVSILAGEGRASRRGVTGGVLFAGLVALSPHFVFIGGVLLAGVAAAALRRRRDVAVVAVIAAAVAAAVSLPWIASALSVSGSAPVSLGDLALFRTAADPRLGLVPNVMGLYGFWRHGWPLSKDVLGGWPVFLAAILCVAAVGIARSRRATRGSAHTFGPIAFGLGLAGAVGLFLSLGDREPTGAVFRWLFVQLPPFRLMREPQKFLILLALAYAVFFGVGLAAIVREMRSRRGRVVVAALLLTVPCVYSFRSFWGFDGYVRPSTIPASWSAADRLMGTGPGAVLALPWHEYLPFPWTQERVVANPMSSAFARITIVGNDPEFGPLESFGTDPRAAAIGAILSGSSDGGDLGVLLAPLGVRYIVLAKVDDWQAYAWLYRQRDLRVIGDWPDLAVFRYEASPMS